MSAETQKQAAQAVSAGQKIMKSIKYTVAGEESPLPVPRLRSRMQHI